MRSLGASKIRWEETLKNASSLDELKKSVRADGNASPCKSGLRSAFLLFHDTDVEKWPKDLGDSRSAYASLRDHFLRLIEKPDALNSSLDPLDDDQHSPWNTVRQDEEIRAEIFQDIERCMPEEPFFRQPRIQTIMLDVLFIFCRLNQDVGYRQGMHEILAPILWVVEEDAIDPVMHPKTWSPSTHPIMRQTLDHKFIEHDAFTLFSQIMRSAKPFYELGEPDKRSGPGGGSPEIGASPIVERSMRIHETYLACLDPELANHLTVIEVLPQIFLIRWIRLLFGREFPFNELLSLWDFLFGEDPDLELVDMICVAMLLRVRWQLMAANYSFALMLLLKYPSPAQPHGPSSFVDDAIFLRDNFSAAGGSKIISKYSGKAPLLRVSSRPQTPLGQAISRRGYPFTRARSPIPSPARAPQQSGGVEALIHGAAKGVLDHGERLGINQAVRDAVGEVRRNMQGLQNNRGHSRTPSEIGRWSLDNGRMIPASTVAGINHRNQQLARMLDSAMKDLRAATTSTESDKAKCVEAMDLAIAKVDFVKIYLEDQTIPLPEEQPLNVARTHSPPETPHGPQSPTKSLPIESARRSEDMVVIQDAEPSIVTPAVSMNDASLRTPNVTVEDSAPKEIEQHQENALLQLNARSTDLLTSTSESKNIAVLRPTPIPTRSSIAQSSFSWMLEPDTPHGSAPNSPPKSSPFPRLSSRSARRPTSAAGRDRAAFLFGEDGGESLMLSPSGDNEEGFNMGSLKRGTGE